MTVMDDVKSACDRLAPLGWRDLLLRVSDGALDIRQPSAVDLQDVLTRTLPRVDRGMPGFGDFHPDGDTGLAPGRPACSLLYHAMASSHVLRGAGGALLQAFATIRELEAIENAIFALRGSSLDALSDSVGGGALAVVVYAAEYRPAADCIDGRHADLTFSRTGLARIGTARARYLPERRGYWPEDANDMHAFRVVPVRLGAWLATRVAGTDARVMRLHKAGASEAGRSYWIPVHKLFDGTECLRGLDLALDFDARFFNLKLQRVMQSFDPNDKRTSFPFVVEQDLATLIQSGEHGRVAVVPKVHKRLVEPAVIDGRALSFRVPARPAEAFATYTTPFENTGQGEIHPYPAYVHARTQVRDGNLVDLNEQADVGARVAAGGYDALLYRDMTGEGWVNVSVPALSGQPKVDASTRAAYLLLSAPDFFPSAGQRELSRWAGSEAIPASFRGKQIWGVEPEPLSEVRLPANLQLPDHPFDTHDDTLTAVVAMGRSAEGPPPATLPVDTMRASTLPDDGAGVFAPGWDVSVDVLKVGGRKLPHLAGYGLGSPFPEDAKLCAALSTFWPAVAPDVYRSMSPHTGNPGLRGSVAPLTDDEIGRGRALPWDGVAGPRLIEVDGKEFLEMASFLHVDYVAQALENRFSQRLTARISVEEYQRRVLAAARIHWVLSGGVNVRPTRTRWLIVSFRRTSPGDAELQQAQQEATHVLRGPVYYALASFVGDGDPSVAVAGNPRLRRIELKRRNEFFVAADEPVALRRTEAAAQWAIVNAE